MSEEEVFLASRRLSKLEQDWLHRKKGQFWAAEGALAGEIFRLREQWEHLFVFGSVVPEKLSKSIRETSFGKLHFETREGFQQNRRVVTEEKWQHMVQRLRSQVRKLHSKLNNIPLKGSRVPSFATVEMEYVHKVDGGTSESELCRLLPGDMTLCKPDAE